MLPDRVTIIFAAAGATLTLGEQHPATMALSCASETMDKIDLWHAKQLGPLLRYLEGCCGRFHKDDLLVYSAPPGSRLYGDINDQAEDEGANP